MKWMAFPLLTTFMFAFSGIANAQTAAPSPSPSSPTAKAESSDIGIQRLNAIFEGGQVNPDLFDARLLEKLPITTIERQIALFKIVAGNYESATRSSVPPTDPRLTQLSHYVATFSAGTADIYLHFDETQKIDGIFLLPIQPKRNEDQGSRYIKPPTGWTRVEIAEKLSNAGLVEMFFAPESAMGYRQNVGIFVAQSDSPSLKLALDKMKQILPTKIFNIVEKPKRCGRFEGADITAEQSTPFGAVAKLYEVVVLANLKLYVATYTRLREAEDSPTALDAINSLCDNSLFGGVASR